MNVFDLDAYLHERRRWIEATLEERLPPGSDADPGRLRAALRHATLAGGKRLRPVLCLAGAEAVGEGRPLLAACAVELVHAYSLVHDDLPAMDDADTRRGAPTVHKAFGEAAAVLAGDALLTMAFELLATEGIRQGAEGAYLQAIHELARAAGPLGMVGGQAIDLDLKDKPPATLRELEACHAGKTAALFQAAVAVGALCGGGSADQVQLLRGYGFDLGLAFQHADDLADGEHQRMAGEARARARELCRRAAATAERFGDRGRPLRAIADLVERRAGDKPSA